MCSVDLILFDLREVKKLNRVKNISETSLLLPERMT